MKTKETSMIEEKLDAMVWGAFYGDAYALGAHWIYDTQQIEDFFLTCAVSDSREVPLGCQNPISNYHPTKKAGDFTHYGDQMLWLLEHLADEDKFSLVSFGQKWKEYMQNYEGYIDGASKHTLSKLNESNNYLACGSPSSDLSVIGRMFPIVYKHHNSLLELQESIKLHTILTHMNKDLVDAAAFFSELIMAVLHGADLSSTINESSQHFGENIKKWVIQAKEVLELNTVDAIKKLGQSCGINGGFASTIYILLKYENNFDFALKENVMAGGDSAARGMIVGATLGVINYEQLLYGNYLQQINKHEEIQSLLKKL
jgi:ADP-ribosylglycohydrolase